MAKIDEEQTMIILFPVEFASTVPSRLLITMPSQTNRSHRETLEIANTRCLEAQ